jgi:hypothetical protein
MRFNIAVHAAEEQINSGARLHALTKLLSLVEELFSTLHLARFPFATRPRRAVP